MLKRIMLLIGVTTTVAACEHSPTTPDDSVVAGTPSLRAAGDGLVRSETPADNPGPPYYARIEPVAPHFYVAEDWVVIAFYRDPECIRSDFNLMTFFDPPAAFGCSLMVEGFALSEVAMGAPKVADTRGTGAVPFWFIPTDALFAAAADGVLTIGELAGLPGRLVGHTTQFNEMLHPAAIPGVGGGHPVPTFTQDATGTLEDGRRFHYHVNSVNYEVLSIQLHVE